MEVTSCPRLPRLERSAKYYTTVKGVVYEGVNSTIVQEEQKFLRKDEEEIATLVVSWEGWKSFGQAAVNHSSGSSPEKCSMSR